MTTKKLFSRLLMILSVMVLVTLACGRNTATSEDLDISVSAPTSAIKTGESFSLSVMIHNTGKYNAEISQVKLPNRLLQGATLKTTSPTVTRLEAESNQTPFALDLTIAPNGKETVTFTFTASQEGSFEGTGGVLIGAGIAPFQASVVISGSQTASEPEASESSPTPIPLGPIPYQAIVQISAVVEVEGREIIGWTGSGTIISPDGFILTNGHVVLSDRFYTVKDLIVSLTLAQDSPPVDTYRASVIQADAKLDIAVIKIRADMQNNPIDTSTLNLPSVPIGNSDGLQLGDSIVILGYPGIGGETITLTRGEVSGFTAEDPYGNRAFVKTSATIAGGNSGGMAANEKGEIIGIPTQVGSGDINISIVDCRPLADTNRDGLINENDSCVPTGGFINALRPINLALGMIQAAKDGQVAVDSGESSGEEFDPEGNILYEDNFSDPTSGWYTATDTEGYTDYENGELVIEVKRTNYIIWSDIQYENDGLLLQVDARIIRGVGNGDFGFICGLQDNENFTVLEISEDGYFSFWKYLYGKYQSLVEWTYSDVIAAGGPFTLYAYCGTDNLLLAVNDTVLGTYYDQDFMPGMVGLAAGTYDVSGFKVGFDNFVMMKP